jgi:hypothetical protein
MPGPAILRARKAALRWETPHAAGSIEEQEAQSSRLGTFVR